MRISVREMAPEEADLVIDYFHRSPPEHLELLGVDPTRLQAPDAWRNWFQKHFAMPIDARRHLFVTWLADNDPVGFSSCDKIVYGECATMHLHVFRSELRAHGIGTECARQSAALYFEKLRLKHLFCEPNALNIAPNRTLQKAGFKYIKTHMTVPGPMNYHQAVTRWVFEPLCGTAFPT
jgi:RimJ/RimL family protein N-acetyltransferase